jgi:hypothetical protein
MTMVKKFVEMRDDLVKASEDIDANFEVDSTQSFLRSTKKLNDMLSQIMEVTVALQERLLTLAHCREMLGYLLQESQDMRNNANSSWHENQFFDQYIGPDSDKLTYPDFVKGVSKIQEGKVSTMSAAEQEACRVLVNEAVSRTGANGGSATNEDTTMGESNVSRKIKALGEKRKASKISTTDSVYYNCNFILGSAAEVERLWSESQWLLDRHRSNLDPKLFEAILLLRKNRDLWIPMDVAYAFDAQQRESGEIRERKLAEESKNIECGL